MFCKDDSAARLKMKYRGFMTRRAKMARQAQSEPPMPASFRCMTAMRCLMLLFDAAMIMSARCR